MFVIEELVNRIDKNVFLVHSRGFASELKESVYFVGLIAVELRLVDPGDR
jgi:hypothetical protein